MSESSAPNLLSPDYPFDQFQRYSDVRLIVQALAADLGRSSLRVLDVGGTKLAHRFLAEHEVLISNLIPAPEAGLQASGVQMPFADDAYDLVITVDTLEHIPPDLRARFVAELARVAAQGVIITGPFANGGINEQAELLLDDYLTNMLGQPYPFLSEHREFGLPIVAETLAPLTAAGFAAAALPSGYTHRWLPLMLIRFGLYQVDQGVDLANALEGIYNRHFYWRDHRAPSYRQLIVSTRNAGFLDGVEQLFAGSDAGEAPDLAGVTALWQGLYVKQALAERDAVIQSLHTQVEELGQLVNAYESGRVMRLLRVIDGALRAAGLKPNR